MLNGGSLVMISSRRLFAHRFLKRCMPVAIIGVVAVTAGIALPTAFPAVAQTPLTNPAPDSNNVGKLTYTPPPLTDAPDPKSMLTRLAGATAIVLVLCVGTIWLGKRWLGGASG